MTKRPVTEWIGKTPTTPLPPRVKLRIVDRQGGKCAETGLLFNAANQPEFDHIVALVNGGENRETNYQALSAWAHKQKTKKDVAEKKKVERIRKRNLGIRPKKKKIPYRRFNGDPIWPD